MPRDRTRAGVGKTDQPVPRSGPSFDLAVPLSALADARLLARSSTLLLHRLFPAELARAARPLAPAQLNSSVRPISHSRRRNALSPSSFLLGTTARRLSVLASALVSRRAVFNDVDGAVGVPGVDGRSRSGSSAARGDEPGCAALHAVVPSVESPALPLDTSKDGRELRERERPSQVGSSGRRARALPAGPVPLERAAWTSSSVPCTRQGARKAVGGAVAVGGPVEQS